jgi:hypothetical protein
VAFDLLPLACLSNGVGGFELDGEALRQTSQNLVVGELSNGEIRIKEFRGCELEDFLFDGFFTCKISSSNSAISSQVRLGKNEQRTVQTMVGPEGICKHLRSISPDSTAHLS